MSWFSKKQPEYIEISLEAYKEQLGVAPGQAVCMPSRGRNLTGYSGGDDCGLGGLIEQDADYHTRATPHVEPQRERPSRPIDTEIRSEPSKAYPRRWHGEEVAIEVTQEFERIKR